jgi:hypothetical protein
LNFKLTSAVSIAAIALGGLAACGQNNSAGLTPLNSGGGSSQAQSLPVTVSLFVPKTLASSAIRASDASAAQKPLYLPSTVNSVTVLQTQAAGAAVTNPTSLLIVIGGPSCTASTGGQTCTATLQGALGYDTWTITSFVSGNGSGSALSTNAGTLDVLSGVSNVLALTLNPILASMTFLPVGDSANATTAVTLPVVLQARDTSGAIIVGPGSFVTAANVANPITLTSSAGAGLLLQTTAGAPASTTMVTPASNNLGQIVYGGTLYSGGQTLTASAGGIAPAVFNLTLTLSGTGLSVPASVSLGENLGTTSTPIAITEPGFGGNYTLTSSSCTGIVTFPATSGPGPTTSATVTQVGGGTCTILVSDGANSASVTVYSTTLGIVLQ